MALAPRVLMLGTGDFALPTFEHLHHLGYDIAALVTQPDRPQGRKQVLIPSLIKQSAITRGVRVEQPENVNGPEALDLIRQIGPDLLVTAAYGQILSAELLSIPSLGGINLHGSILPSYRGAAPVARAIQKGEVETGVTVIRMTPLIDAGGMISFGRTMIDPAETAGELEARLALIGAPLIAEAIQAIMDGTIQVIPQRKARVTRAPKLRKEDGRIDWSQSAASIHNLIRAMQPWPVASTTWRRPEDQVRLIIHQAEPCEGTGTPGQVLEAMGDRFVIAAGQGAVRLLKVQLEGKKPSPVTEFLCGHHPLGDVLEH